MILNEQLNNTVWQIEASELAYDATQGAFTATITPAIDIDGTYTVIVPKGTFNIVSTEDGTTPEQIVDNMSASVNVVFSADPVALQITPAEGKLTEITSITISYTDDNGTAYSLVPVITDSEAVPTVTLAKGTETVLSLDADKIYDYEVIENENPHLISQAKASTSRQQAPIPSPFPQVSSTSTDSRPQTLRPQPYGPSTKT